MYHPCSAKLYWYCIDQFSILDLNKTRILGYYCQGSTFFDREILVDVSTAGFCANPVKYFMLLRGCLCARTCWLLGVIEEFLNLKFFLWAN
jgi:hypothetical protein